MTGPPPPHHWGTGASPLWVKAGPRWRQARCLHSPAHKRPGWCHDKTMLCSRLAEQKFFARQQTDPCSPGYDEEGLARIGNSLRDLPHHKSLPCLCELGTSGYFPPCVLQTVDCGAEVQLWALLLMYLDGAKCLSLAWVLGWSWVSASSFPHTLTTSRAGSARIHNPGFPSPPRLHSHFSTKDSFVVNIPHSPSRLHTPCCLELALLL